MVPDTTVVIIMMKIGGFISMGRGLTNIFGVWAR